MAGRMDCQGLTDAGKVRKTNQDQYLIAELNKSMRIHDTSLGLDRQTRLFGSAQGRLLLVADGMGGRAAGERASTIAIDSITGYLLNAMRWVFQPDQDGDNRLCRELKSAFEHCQTMLRAEAEAMPERRGMGTTLTMAYIVWPRLYVAHVGDSRCYLFRDAKLRQITRDHTVAQQCLESRLMDPEQAAASPLSHTLWNVIGGSSKKLSAEVYKAEMMLGDTLLLCTDGLTKHVSDEQIGRCLQRDLSSGQTCRRLVQAANDAGGSDNITVVVARFTTKQPQQPDAAEKAASLEAAGNRSEPAGNAAAPMSLPEQ